MFDFSLTDLVCKHCGKKVEGIATEDWVVEFGEKGFESAICPECFPKFGAKEGSQILESVSQKPVFEFEAPLVGNFRPVKNSAEISHFRDAGELGESWWQLEMDMVELFNEYKTIKLGVQTSEYDEIWVKYEWVGKTISRLVVIGDKPRKRFELSVYQRARLQKMGFHEIGEINKEWILDLNSTESDFKNVARITSHVLQFGLLLQAHKIYGLAPIVDTDENDRVD